MGQQNPDIFLAAHRLHHEQIRQVQEPAPGHSATPGKSVASNRRQPEPDQATQQDHFLAAANPQARQRRPDASAERPPLPPADAEEAPQQHPIDNEMGDANHAVANSPESFEPGSSIRAKEDQQRLLAV